MNRASQGSATDGLDPEKLAYWYFRLNGFFQIENFVIHPARRGGQRTDADLLAVRFPHRAERLFDDSNDIMADDEQRLVLSPDHIDVLIVEVKTNQPCTLNGPWTQEDSQTSIAYWQQSVVFRLIALNVPQRTFIGLVFT